jgi:hypothetical protein
LARPRCTSCETGVSVASTELTDSKTEMIFTQISPVSTVTNTGFIVTCSRATTCLWYTTSRLYLCM